MAWIEKIRNKSRAEKIRLIWIWVIIAAVLLIILWIATWGYKKSAPIDTSLINTFSTGINKAKDQFKPINK